MSTLEEREEAFTKTPYFYIAYCLDMDIPCGMSAKISNPAGTKTMHTQAIPLFNTSDEAQEYIDTMVDNSKYSFEVRQIAFGGKNQNTNKSVN